jgi:FKBP-type peptidyl-prolyl cis-trans isomerase SlyD
MIIENRKVVCFHYALKSPDGTVIESTDEDQPAVYLHGANNILPALEQAMAGKQAGEGFSIELAPGDAYGLRNEALIERIAVKHLQSRDRKLRPGSIAVVSTDKGQRQVTIVKMGKFQATVDGNHPLAGQTIVFDIRITDIRDANPEELAHGHAHGPDGHAEH